VQQRVPPVHIRKYVGAPSTSHFSCPVLPDSTTECLKVMEAPEWRTFFPPGPPITLSVRFSCLLSPTYLYPSTLPPSAFFHCQSFCFQLPLRSTSPLTTLLPSPTASYLPSRLYLNTYPSVRHFNFVGLLRWRSYPLQPPKRKRNQKRTSRLQTRVYMRRPSYSSRYLSFKFGAPNPC
jgi:hypothetical protein